MTNSGSYREEREAFHLAFIDLIHAYEAFDQGSRYDRELSSGWNRVRKAVDSLRYLAERLDFARRRIEVKRT